MTDQISESISKVKNAAGLDRKIRAARELLGQARDLGAHTARYARIAWLLDMLFLFFAILVFGAVMSFQFIKDILPPGLYQIIESVYQSSGFTDAVKAWLYCELGLLAVPVVFFIILSVICRHTPVTVGITADGTEDQPSEEPDGEEDELDSVWRYVWDQLDCYEKLLKDVNNELNPLEMIPFWPYYVLCLLFMGSAIADLYEYVAIEGGWGITAIIAGIIMFALLFGFFLLLVFLKLSVWMLFFSNGKSSTPAGELYNELRNHRQEYREQYEGEEQNRREEEKKRRRLADLEEGAELYKKAVQGETVDDDLMILAAEKGDPRASLYVGEQILMLIEDNGLTAREIAEYREDAKDYLKVAADAGIPDGIFMYAATQVMTEAHDENGWMEILRRIRAIDRTKLSEMCVNTYDMVVEQLVEAVDDAAARADALKRKQQAEDAALWEEIKNRRCRYSNDGVCTLKSTASFLYHCTGDGSNICVNYAK